MQESSNYVGRRLGNYRLMQRLGRGGFAEVYLGEHIHLKTQVAIKVLLTHLTREAVETFRSEAQTIARLRHPSIVQVHDFGIEDDTAYLVMDYAPHGTLRQYQPKGSVLPPATVVTYVKQVAEALQYAHDQRLIHRDVKPENMLLGPRREVLLSDFGIALMAHGSFSQNTQNIAGTVAYMAPEQMQGHSRPASDQYALGVVVYEWLCGNRPFQGTFTEIALQHTIKPPPSLRQYLPTIPFEIEQVVMKALQKDPQQRFPTVRVFAQALEQACQQQHATITARTFQMTSALGQPQMAVAPKLSSRQHTPPGLERNPFIFSTATPPPSYSTSFPAIAASPAQPSRRFSRRLAMIGGVGLVAAASSGLTWALLSRRAPVAAPPVFSGGTPVIAGKTPTSSTALIPATASLVTYQGHDDDVVGVAWSLDGTYLATVAQDGTAQVWTTDAGKRLFTYRSQVTPAQSNDDALAVLWSHDSKRIVVGFADGTAQRVDARNGRELFSYGNGSAAINALAWSPNENFLALASADGSVQVYEAASGKMTTQFKGHLDGVTTVVWSHDGKHIASGSEDTTVQVWNASTGQPLLTFKEHTKKVSSVAWSADDSHVVSCSWDNTAMIWDAQFGRTLLAYTKHKGGWLNAVAWSPDGRYIASAGEIGTVTGNVFIGTRGTRDVNMHVWEAATGNTHAIYQSLPVNGLAWSPDGTSIATACSNKIAQIWRTP